MRVSELDPQDMANVLRNACTFLDSWGWDQEYLRNPTRDHDGQLSLAGALMVAAGGDATWYSQNERQCEVLKFTAEALVRQEPSLAKVRSTDRARDLRIIARWNGAHGRTKEQVQAFLTVLADATWKPATMRPVTIRRRHLGEEARADRGAEECRESGLAPWYRAQAAARSCSGSRPSPERGIGDISLDVRMLEALRESCRGAVIRSVEPCDQEFPWADPAH